MRIFEKNYSHQKMRNKISHKPVHVKNEARLVDFGRKSIGGHARYHSTQTWHESQKQ